MGRWPGKGAVLQKDSRSRDKVSDQQRWKEAFSRVNKLMWRGMWVKEGEGDRGAQDTSQGLGRRGKGRKTLKRYRTREELRRAFKKQSVVSSVKYHQSDEDSEITLDLAIKSHWRQRSEYSLEQG